MEAVSSFPSARGTRLPEIVPVTQVVASASWAVKALSVDHADNL